MLRKALWAVSDQFLFSGSNFLLNIMLARWLSPIEYGIFSVFFAIFLLMGAFHSAIVTDPLLVFGSEKYAKRFPQYLGAVTYGHMFVSLAVSLVLVLLVLLLGYLQLDISTYPCSMLAIVIPFILFLWLMRRACYAQQVPILAASGSAIYLVLTVLGTIAFFRQDWLSPVSSFLVMGVASGLSGLWIAQRLKLRRPLAGRLVWNAARDHWLQGRWGLLINILVWVPGNLYFLLLAAFGQIEESGALKALMNIYMPIYNINAALSTLLIPYLVQARDTPQFKFLLHRGLIGLVLLALIFWIGIGMAGNTVFEWLYKGQYSEYANWLWVIGAVSLGSALVAVYSAALRAKEKQKELFAAYVVSTTITLTAGIYMTIKWGVVGAAFGLVISALTTAIAMSWSAIDHKRKNHSHAESVV